MAAILKGKTKNDKDVLVLKHSEVSLWHALDKPRQKTLRQVAHIFIYFGYYMPVTKRFGFEDGWITLRDTVHSIPDDVIWLDFGGINFLDDLHHSQSEKKQGSLCCITNDTPRKGLHSLILALLFSRSPSAVTMVIQQNATSLRDRLYAAILAFLLALLRLKLGRNLSLTRSGREGRLSRAEVFNILASSQHLVLPSFAEGAARVVGEAQLSQTRIIMRRAMRGSTHLVLSEQDKQFDSLFELIKQLQTCGYEPFSAAEMIEHEHRLLARYQEPLFFEALKAHDIFVHPVSLVNLFSGQKNVLPKSITGDAESDQLKDAHHLAKLVDIIIADSLGK